MNASRCYLDNLSPGDLPFLSRMFTCPEVRRFLGGPVDADKADGRSENWIARSFSEPIWAIRRRPDQAFLGWIILDEHHEGEYMELSYALLPEHWGEGYATEALQLALHRALTDHGLHEVVSETQARNEKSTALLARVGMTEYKRLVRFGEEQVIFRGPTKRG